MRRTHIVAACLSLLLIAAPAFGQTEASLRAADAAQYEAARTENAEALEAMMLPSFIINSPTGDVGTGQRTIERFRSGEVAHEKFTRIVERIAITENVGIVMGYEIARLTATSIDGKARGGDSSPVLRRFTNIYLWQNNKWGWLARHAAYRPEKPSAEVLAKETE
jgi:ketosteroid isomerase-like protein